MTIAFMKILGDLCVYFAVACSIPFLFPHSFPMVYVGLILAAVAGVGAGLSGTKKPLLRLLPLPAVLCVFLLCDLTMDFVLVIPAVAYTAIVVISGKFDHDVYAFRSIFKTTMKFLLLFSFFIFAFHTVEQWAGAQYNSLDPEPAFAYLCIYALTGVFSLRQLRSARNEMKKIRYANSAQIVSAVTAAGALAFVLIRFSEQIKSLFLFLTNLVITVFLSLPLLALAWMDSDTGDSAFHLLQVRDYLEKTQNNARASMFAKMAEIYEARKAARGEQFPTGLVILVMAVMLVIFAVLIINMKKRKQEAQPAGHTKIQTTESARKRRETLTNREKIRKYYRSFLKTERKKGHTITSSHTSQVILDEASILTNMDGAKSLRELYIKARYDDSPVTQEDVEAARLALKRSQQTPSSKQ